MADKEATNSFARRALSSLHESSITQAPLGQR